jgi:hypothetical protein
MVVIALNAARPNSLERWLMKIRSVLVMLPVLLSVAFFIGGQTGPVKASVIPPPVTQNQSQDQSAVKTFTGTILSQNGERFILRDDINEVWYHLDNQQQVAKFSGKNVLVTGVLDGPTVTIRVRSIVEAKT